jgi:hypothetical protein
MCNGCLVYGCIGSGSVMIVEAVCDVGYVWFDEDMFVAVCFDVILDAWVC